MEQALESAQLISWTPQPQIGTNAASPEPAAEPPCMSSALLRLELLLRDTTVDLGAVCNVILNDIGLTLAMLRLSNTDPDLPTRIQDIVLCLGTDSLRAWARRRSMLRPGCRASRSAMAQLTQHSRLVARAAEAIAPFVDGANREEAYLGGLLHDIGLLPRLLGNKLSDLSIESIETGLNLARMWQMPDFVAEAIESQRQLRRASPLGQVVSAAHEWTLGVEQALRARTTHLHISWSRSIVERWLPSVSQADSEIMFEYLDSCVEPLLAGR
jgi:HD-like signal output (HDOD) protein